MNRDFKKEKLTIRECTKAVQNAAEILTISLTTETERMKTCKNKRNCAKFTNRKDCWLDAVHWNSK
jgi:hypothetical protein